MSGLFLHKKSIFNGPNHGIRLILRSFLKTVVPLGASLNQKWAPGEAKTKTVGPLGRKVVTLNPPLSTSHGAQRGVGVTTFRPNGPPERLTALMGPVVLMSV